MILLYNIITTINPYLLLTISVIFAWIFNVTSNTFAKISNPNEQEVYFGLIIKQVFGALILLLLFGFQIPSLFTLFLSLLFGTCIALSVFASQSALCYGPMTVSIMITSSGPMIINAVFGAIFWQEKLSIIKIIGIIGMVIMMYLIMGVNSDGKKSSSKFFIFAFTATLFSTSLGFIQKTEQRSEYKSEIGMFLILSFLTSALILFIIMLIRKSNTQKVRFNNIFNKKTLPLLLLSGLGYSALHTLNLYLSGRLQSVVFFPVANGGPMILTVIAAIVLFHERPTKKQITGVIIGIVSIIFLGEIWA